MWQIFIVKLYNLILFDIMLKHVWLIQYSNNLCSRYLNVFQIIRYYRCIISSNNRLILFSRLCFQSNEPEKSFCVLQKTHSHTFAKSTMIFCTFVCPYAPLYKTPFGGGTFGWRIRLCFYILAHLLTKKVCSLIIQIEVFLNHLRFPIH